MIIGCDEVIQARLGLENAVGMQKEKSIRWLNKKGVGKNVEDGSVVGKGD